MTSGHSPLTIQLAATSQRHTIILEGEIDLAGAPELEAVIAGVCAGEPRTIVLDLRKVTFLDSAGVHCLIAANQACCQRGHELQIIPGPANVQRLFELTGTTDFLPFTDGATASADGHSPAAARYRG